MTTISISLPDALKAFVDAEMVEGGYRSASDYFHDLVREAQRQKARERLEALLLEGLDSGEATEMTAEDWQRIRQAMRERNGQGTGSG